MTALKGLDKVLKNLNKKVSQIEGRTIGGLLAAGAIVQAESQRRVPVEYGNLRASAFTRKALDTRNKKAVEVGYTAAYAMFVHENIEQKLKGEPRPSGLGVYWGPDGEPKFLENAFREKEADILSAIESRVRLGGGDDTGS